MVELTVIVPTFNGSRYLATTLTSLHRQRGVALNVLVIDDGSTDDSLAIAESHPVGARVLRQANLGVAVARNRGLAEASTRWVAFLDQDDLWHPDRATTLLALAHDTGASAVATTEQAFAVEDDRTALERIGDGREHWPSHWISEGQEISSLLERNVGGTDEIEELRLDRLMQAPATVTTSMMYDRLTAIAAGGCAPFVRAADDHVLNVNIARLIGVIPRINRPSLFYRVHPGSTTTRSPLVIAYLTTLLALRHGRALPSRPITSPFVNDLLSELHETSLSPLEQAALLILSTPRGARTQQVGRWAKRCITSRSGFQRRTAK